MCFFFLQETHATKKDFIFWKKQWGDTILFNQGTNRTAGVAICMNNCPGNVIESKEDME